MKITIKDIAVATLMVLGIASDFNWMDVPFWVFIIVGVVYAGLRLAGKTNDPVKK